MECRDAMEGVVVDVGVICGDTEVAELVSNITAMNCSVETPSGSTTPSGSDSGLTQM